MTRDKGTTQSQGALKMYRPARTLSRITSISSINSQYFQSHSNSNSSDTPPMTISNPFRKRKASDPPMPTAVPAFGAFVPAPSKPAASDSLRISLGHKRIKSQETRNADTADSDVDSNTGAERRNDEAVVTTTSSQVSDKSLMPPPPVPATPGVRTQMSNMGFAPTSDPNTALAPRSDPNANAPSANGSQISYATPISIRSGLRLPGQPPLVRRDFIQGDIIWAPHHVTAMDPNANPANNKAYIQSDVATVCSKRRPMIVLWPYRTQLFALPLESHGKSGLSHMSEAIKADYLCLRDPNDLQFRNESKYDPLDVRDLTFKLGQTSTARITGGCVVDFKEEIEFKGRLTLQSTKYLPRLWFEMADAAVDFGWETRRRAIERAERARQVGNP